MKIQDVVEVFGLFDLLTYPGFKFSAVLEAK